MAAQSGAPHPRGPQGRVSDAVVTGGKGWAVGRRGLPLTPSCSHCQSRRSLGRTAGAPGLRPPHTGPSLHLSSPPQTRLHAPAHLPPSPRLALGHIGHPPCQGGPAPPHSGPAPLLLRAPGLRRGPGTSTRSSGRGLPSGEREGQHAEPRRPPWVCGPRAARPAPHSRRGPVHPEPPRVAPEPFPGPLPPSGSTEGRGSLIRRVGWQAVSQSGLRMTFLSFLEMKHKNSELMSCY